MKHKQKHNENRFVNIFTDFGFKLIFGNESNTLFLRKALKALIGLTTSIVTISFNNVELIGLTKNSRSGFVDISCKDDKGNHFLVEMQQFNFSYYFNRLKFYAFQKMNILVEKGQRNFKNLEQIYAVVIIPGVMFPKSKEYHHIAKIYNQKNELSSRTILNDVFKRIFFCYFSLKNNSRP